MKLLFLISVLFVGYAYFGYPLLLLMINKFYRKNHTPKDYFTPNVAIIIPIANESPEKIISKISNTLELSYSQDKIEVVLALDNPSPFTRDLVISQMPGLSNWGYVYSDSQQGKEKMQALACSTVMSADVFVFTDVTTHLNSNAIHLLVRHFDDSSIGVVDGESKIITKEGISSEGIYLRYENKIRELESNINSQVTAGGCLFAASRDVVDQLFLRPTSSDFTCALVANKLGKRVILDKDAVAVFSDLKDTSKEYSRKHRTILRGINTLWKYREMLNPFQYGFFSFQLLSHKVAKWMVPFALLGLLISNLFLVQNSFFLFTLLVQILFYTIAFIGASNQKLTKFWIRIPAFFTVSNVAMFFAWMDFFRGKHPQAWSASVR